MVEDQVRKLLLAQIRVPSASDRVYKDECAFCFDSPYSRDGLYLNLRSYIGYCSRHVAQDSASSGQQVYLCLRRTHQPPDDKPIVEPVEKKPRTLGIGVSGGFGPLEEQRKYDEHLSLFILPQKEHIALPNADLPELVSMAVGEVKRAQSAYRQDAVQAWEANNTRVVSKYAQSLKQLDNGVRIPRSGWQCSLCDMRENLWMNLTDGTILCGRRNWDGTGGNGHALEYFNRTRYPLCVKLATITPEGTADVFSYAEDDMVLDPLLKEHLLHFGIDVTQMNKTEKTIAEMEIDTNLRFEFSEISESGKQLQPMAGPGYTGLKNLGSSCYLASVMQVLFHTAPFRGRYVDQYDAIVRGSRGDPNEDLQLQMAKLGHGLWSGAYSSDQAQWMGPDGSIGPLAFKKLVGKGHAEFSTGRQQDALEYLQHLFTAVQRNDHALGQATAAAPFYFRLVNRRECLQSHMVRYSEETTSVLSVPIPLDAAINLDAVISYQARNADLKARGEKALADQEQPVLPVVPLAACFKAFTEAEVIDGFLSPATGQVGSLTSTTHMLTFPDWLVVQLKKFAIGPDGRDKKLEVRIQAPDELDASALRGHGLLPTEQELPEPSSSTAAVAASAAPAVDVALLGEMMAMGFGENACRRALIATPGQGLEASMTWLLGHLEDANINDPIQPTAAVGAKGVAEKAVDEGSVAMLESLGFSSKHARKALAATNNDTERAAEWLFSRMDSLDDDEATSAPAAGGAGPSTAAAAVSDGAPHYRLAAFISHMGSNTGSGHYVCHIRDGNRWILYNDAHVAISEEPPRELAYLYFYQRV